MSKLKIQILIHLLIFNVLASQVGLNIYSFSCYCFKKISVSLVPVEDQCHSTKKEITSCCKNLGCNKEEKTPILPCGKSEVFYKVGATLAKLNEEYKIQVTATSNLSYVPKLHLCFVNNTQIFSIIFIDHSFYMTGADSRIRYCSLLC